MGRARVGFLEGEYRRYKSLGEGAFIQLAPALLSDEKRPSEKPTGAMVMLNREAWLDYAQARCSSIGTETR